MSIGRMTERVTIVQKGVVYDADGFSTSQDHVICVVWASVDYRHGSVQWRNRAEFSSATAMFTTRYTDAIKPGFFLRHGDKEYAIESVENVANRSAYLEILCSEVVPAGGDENAED